MLLEHSRRDPVLEPTKDGVVGDDLLRHRQTASGNDDAGVAVDSAALDAGEPLLHACGITDDRPDLVRRTADPPLPPYRAARHAPFLVGEAPRRHLLDGVA